MFRPLKHAIAALLLLCAPLAHAADIKPLVNSSGAIRPVHTGETVGVANGGTGATTLTAHCVILGNGTSAPTVACPGSSGNVLTSNGSSADPTFQAGAAGTVTTTGSPASGNLAKFSGSTSITNGDLSGDVTTSGTLATTIASDAVTTSKINNSAVTLAKVANAAANTRFVGSGSSGSGSAYAEQTIAAGTGIVITPGASGITVAATSAVIPTASLSPPQGRLTLVTAQPVLNADQTAKTHVYYTPYVGPNVPLYDGSNWGLQTVTADLDMALDTSNQLGEKIYDLFVWNNSGTLSIGAGPAWSNSATITVTVATPAVVSWTGHGLAEGAPVIFTTTGALPTGITAGTTYYVGRSPGANSFNISTSVVNAAAGTFVATSGTQSGTHTATNATTARGTGAGTTEIQRKDGIWTNKNSITLKNGAGSGTSGIAANTATYVGSVYMTANGQTGMAFQPASAFGGSNNILALYNAYNRVLVIATNWENTASWTYASTTWRALNGSTANRISWVDGLQESHVFNSLKANGQASTSSAWGVGIKFDATAGNPDLIVQSNATAPSTQTLDAPFEPKLGLHYSQAMEAAFTTATMTLFGFRTNTVSGQLQSLAMWVSM